MKPFLFRNGAVHPFGIPLSHSWAAVGAILMAIQEYKIRTFIELGFEHGGLASIMAVRSRLLLFAYVGVDTNPRTDSDVHELMADSSLAHFVFGDVFSVDIIDYVKRQLVFSNYPKMIYCDNGDKPKELRTYAPLLSPGDLIGAHDLDHEYTYDDIKDIPDLERIEAEWLEDTRIVLFRKV